MHPLCIDLAEGEEDWHAAPGRSPSFYASCVKAMETTWRTEEARFERAENTSEDAKARWYKNKKHDALAEAEAFFGDELPHAAAALFGWCHATAM